MTGSAPAFSAFIRGAWPDLALDEGGICKNGAVNVLTKDLPLEAGEWLRRGIRRWHGWRNMRGRRLPLRRLIRLPAHDPRRVLGIILRAVFDAKTLSMIEIHRPHVFLVPRG